MKLLLLATLVGACSAGLLSSPYLPPQQQQFGSSSYSGSGRSANYQQDSGAYSQQYRPRAALERSAAILRSDAELNEAGYRYAYETGNGIRAEEEGHEQDGIHAQGGYEYIGDDGQVYSVRYTAGSNGFQAEGAHIPTPPPVPQEILEALQKNARDEAAGIYDDGSYHEGKYAGDSSSLGEVISARTGHNAFGQANAFSQNNNAYSQNANAYSQNANAYSQNANAYSQTGNAYSQGANAHSINNAYTQNANAYSHNANAYSQSDNAYSKSSNAYQDNQQHGLAQASYARQSSFAQSQASAFAKSQAYSSQNQAFGSRVSQPSRQYLTPKSNGYQY